MSVCSCVGSDSSVAEGENRSHGFCAGALENSKEGVCVFGIAGRCQYANAAALSLIGLQEADLMAQTLTDVLPDLPEDWFAGLPIDVELTLQGKDGGALNVIVSLSRLDCGCTLVVFHGDTVLHRLNRALRLQRACSKVLVHAQSEAQLLHDVCELIVSKGGYRMAWVGLAANDAEKHVHVVAQAGLHDGYLDQVQLSWGDGPNGQGPTGSAIRCGQTQVNQDISTNPRMQPWRDAALARGYHASIALPLLAQTTPCGALTIYSTESDAFTTEEVELLEELAQDLGYGMEAWRAQAQHNLAQADHQVLAERFNYLSQYANDMMLLIDGRGRILEANDRAQQAYGYTHQELLQMNVSVLYAPESGEDFFHDWTLLYEQKHRLYETSHCRKDGSTFPVEKSERLIAVGDKSYVQIILRDITERRHNEQALAASEARYRSLFEHMLEGFAFCRLLYVDGQPVDFIYLKVNAAFGVLSGLHEVEGRKVSEVVPGILDTNPEFFDLCARVVMSGVPERLETYIPTLELWFSLTLYSPEPEHFIVVFDNITKRKAAESRIQFLAQHDVLTSLPNRLLARDRFVQATAYADRAGSQMALLFLDLDNFKAVNDSLGHAQGDRLLQEVAQRLCASVRDTDTVCRQGGDEFMVLLTDLLDSDSVAFIAAKLLERIATPYVLEGLEIVTSASCGVAIYPEDGHDFDTLFKKADTAMYQAKAAGRNACRFFDVQMNIDADQRLGLRSGLRHALDCNEFELYFQPQIDLPSRALVGAETLIRWNHPVLGLVPPGMFIPVAEDSGLIVPIGEWVLRQACRQMAEWRRAGLPDLVVAVNISALQFKRGNLVQVVTSALADAGVPAYLLELELTESILIRDTESVLQTVRQLKAMGVRLSIDDFGTGYSSLAYLKRFAVDKVKIDQSFIQDLANNPSNAAIVQAIIQMAQSLGLKTIAEGVEVSWLLDYLESHQCDQAQGFLIAHPMPADAFVTYRLTHQPGVTDSARWLL